MSLSSRSAHRASVLAALTVAILLLLPAPPGPPGWLAEGLPALLSDHLDKGVHAVLFFALAGIWLRSFDRLPGWPRPIGSAVLFAATYGALLEVLQAITPDRSSSFGDALANLIGALILGAVALVGRFRRVPGGIPERP